MPDLPFTTLAAASLALLMLPLALLVTARRIRLDNVVFGDGNDETLLRRIRAHGNFAEYTPLSLIVLGLVEMHGGPSWLLWTTAAFLVIGRIVHALGTLLAPYAGAPRGIGMLLTHASYLMPALWLLLNAARG
jgi:hypothetical protein